MNIRPHSIYSIIMLSFVTLAVFIISAAVFADTTDSSLLMKDHPNRQSISLLLKLADSLGVSPGVESKLLDQLNLLKEKPITLQTLCVAADRAGMNLSEHDLSFKQLEQLRSPALISLKGPDRFAVVMAIGTKYSLIWNNTGVDDYVDTSNLEENYNGSALLLHAVTKPMIAVSNPIISAVSKGPMTNVSAVIGYKNISDQTISVTPKPCGCSQAPRGVVDKTLLKPGATAHLTITALMPQYAPYCLPLPMQTNSKGAPIVFLGIMCLPPKQITSYPAAIQLQTKQHIQASQADDIYIPYGDSLESIAFQKQISYLNLTKQESDIDAPASCPTGKVENCIVTVDSTAPLGSLQDNIVVTYGTKQGEHTAIYPCKVDVKPDSWATPSGLFLGIVPPGTNLTRGITVHSNSLKEIYIVKAIANEAGVKYNVPTDGSNSVDVVIHASKSPNMYFQGHVALYLSDGSLIIVHYRGITSDKNGIALCVYNS